MTTFVLIFTKEQEFRARGDRRIYLPCTRCVSTKPIMRAQDKQNSSYSSPTQAQSTAAVEALLAAEDLHAPSSFQEAASFQEASFQAEASFREASFREASFQEVAFPDRAVCQWNHRKGIQGTCPEVACLAVPCLGGACLEAYPFPSYPAEHLEGRQGEPLEGHRVEETASLQISETIFKAINLEEDHRGP
jgi:hypothetical protein